MFENGQNITNCLDANLIQQRLVQIVEHVRFDAMLAELSAKRRSFVVEALPNTNPHFAYSVAYSSSMSAAKKNAFHHLRNDTDGKESMKDIGTHSQQTLDNSHKRTRDARREAMAFRYYATGFQRLYCRGFRIPHIYCAACDVHCERRGTDAFSLCLPRSSASDAPIYGLISISRIRYLSSLLF